MALVVESKILNFTQSQIHSTIKNFSLIILKNKFYIRNPWTFWNLMYELNFVRISIFFFLNLVWKYFVNLIKYQNFISFTQW